MAKKGQSVKQRKAQANLKLASKSCRSKGVPPFTKEFGSCVKQWFKNSKKS